MLGIYAERTCVRGEREEGRKEGRKRWRGRRILAANGNETKYDGQGGIKRCSWRKVAYCWLRSIADAQQRELKNNVITYTLIYFDTGKIWHGIYGLRCVAISAVTIKYYNKPAVLL